VEGCQVIRSLEVNNFRCFKSASFPDLRRLNIVTGKNGSGKTALLESLFVVGGGSAEIYIRTNIFRGRDFIGFTPDSVMPIFEDFFYNFDPTDGMRIVFKDSNGDEREVRIVVGSKETINLPFDRKASEATASRDLRFIWKSPKGQTDSVVEVTKDGLRINQPTDVFPMVFLNQMTVGSPKDNADRWSVISAKNQEHPVEEAVRKLFPAVLGLSVLSSAGTPAVHVLVKGLDRKIPAGLLSAGVNKFISILVAISFAANGAVLIDEIENGLYYKTHRGMWEAIAEFAVANKTQIFATTHSKEFLEAIAPIVESDEKNHSFLRLEKENGQVKIESFAGKEYAGAVKSGFEVR
jgi:AAA15 family ATPase/GTPase